MSKVIKSWTEIKEHARRNMDISRDEYALCSYVLYRSGDPRMAKSGWCTDSKDDIAYFVGISRPGLYKMIDRLEKKGLLEVTAPFGYMRATVNFIDTENLNECKQSLQDAVNKVYSGRKQSLQDGVNKVTVIKENNIVEQLAQEKENLAPDGAALKVPIYEMKEETIELKTDSEQKAPPSPAPPPKRSKAEPKPPALIHEMVKRFEDAHKKHFSPDGTWIGFAWGDGGKNGKSGGKQFAGLAGLKEKLIASFALKMFRIPEDAEILDSFSKFLEVSVEADPFVLANWFTPCLLNSNYQSIIQRIHNARQPKNITNGPRGNAANTASTVAGVFNQGIDNNGQFDPKYGY